MTALPPPSFDLPKLPELPTFAAPEMPSFDMPDLAPAPAPRLAGLPGTKERAKHVDSIVKANRAKVPAAVADKRTTPRLSIDELNQSDPDELKDRFLNTQFDTRTPVQKVLDLIDLPRNVIANIAFHDTAQEQAGKGEYAALGLPKVSVSDAMRSAGVENRVALALGGFVGDVVLDPLTYVGPAGAAKSIAGTTLRSGGAKALKGAIKEAAVSGVDNVANTAARDILKASGVTAALRDKQAIRKAAEEGFAKYGQAAKTADNVLEHPQIDAFKNFTTQYGRGTGGGIKFGVGGSEIAHIPLGGHFGIPEWTVQVPAFTSEAQRTIAQFARAKDLKIADDVLQANPAGKTAIGLVKADVDGIRADINQLHQANAVTVAGPGAVTPIDVDAVNAAVTSKLDNIAKTITAHTYTGNPDLSPNTIQSLAEMHDEAKALVDQANATRNALRSANDPDKLADAYSQMVEAAQRYQGLIGGTIDSHIKAYQNKGLDDMVALGKAAIGTDDSTIGSTMFGSMASAFGNAFGDSSVPSRAMRAVDRQFRTRFGLRNGTEARRLSDVQYRITGRAKRVMGEVLTGRQHQISELMHANGVPVSMMDDAHLLATTMQYEEAAKRLGLAPGATVALKRVKNGALVDSEVVKRYNKMMADFRAAGAPQQFFDGLRAIVADEADKVAQMGDVEMSNYLLSQMIPGYVPNVTALAAQKSLNTKKGAGLAWQAMSSPAGNLPRETFQRTRTTALHQFKDDQGVWHEFLGLDRNKADMPAAELATLRRDNPAAAAEIDNLKDVIAKYDALGDKAPPPLTPSMMDLNDLHANGRFGPISVGDTDFFEESFPMIAANRAAMHERSLGRAELAKIANDNALPINSKQFLELAGKVGGAKDLTLPSGEVANIVTVKGRFGGDVPILIARGRRWRPLDKSMAGYADNPIISSLYDGAKDVVLPEELADKIEDVANAFKDDSLEGVLKHIDHATGIFKSAVLFRPSWTIFDVVGNITNAASGGIDVPTMLKRLPEAIAAKTAEHNPAKVANFRLSLPDGDLVGEAAIKHLQDLGIVDKNIPAEIALQTSLRGLSATPSMMARKGFIGDIKTFVPDLKTDAKFWMENYSKSLGNKPLAGAATALTGGWDRINRMMLAPWVRANAFVNDSMRTAAYLSLRDAGHDANSAANQVRRAMFDMHDLTHFEKRYMRTLFPFYSWMRANLPFQMMQLFQRPAYLNAVPKVQRAIEEAVDGEQRVPMNLRPRWMRNAIATQIGTDPNTRISLALGNSIPQGDVLNILTGLMGYEGAKETLHYFGSATNPVVQTPMEIAAGRELFSGRTIGADETSGDIPIGEFLSNKIGPVGFGRSVAKAFGSSPTEGVARTLVGGRVQNFSDDRLRSTRGRELKDQAEGIRNGIMRLERDGDKAKSLNARAKLLKVYEEAVKLGLEKEVRVPAWAKRTLNELATTNNQE